MTTVISLSEEAYRILRAHKRSGESFSKTVIRLARTKGTMTDLFDEGPVEGAEEFARYVEEVRKELDKRL
jgi:predicted CopG family antitoxin